MKLRDILREIEDQEGDGLTKKYAKYDLAVKSNDINSVLKALDNINNYGMYAQNLRDPKVIAKVFGPSIPAQKAGAAWKDWDSRSEDDKISKINDIKNRVPDAWTKIETEAEKGYSAWKEEGNEGTLENYLITLSGKTLPKEFVGKYGANYFPMKTPDNLKKYAGKLEKDVHYNVDGDKVIFPQSKSPYNPKSYLEKVITTIMDNGKVKYELLDVEREEGEEIPLEKPEEKAIKPIDFRDLDSYVAEEIADSIKRKYPEIKVNILTSEESDEVVLRIKGFKNNAERAKIQGEASKMLTDLMESLTKRMFQVRAGIIK